MTSSSMYSLSTTAPTRCTSVWACPRSRGTAIRPSRSECDTGHAEPLGPPGEDVRQPYARPEQTSAMPPSARTGRCACVASYVRLTGSEAQRRSAAGALPDQEGLALAAVLCDNGSPGVCVSRADGNADAPRGKPSDPFQSLP